MLSDHSCQLCDPSCSLCNQTSTTCQKCKNVSGVVYFYFASECLVACPNGMYGEKSNNTCTVCNPACLLCFGPLTTQCYSCQVDSSTGIYYYLSYATTSCVPLCPYGQYAVNSSFTCQLCNMNCATCAGTSTNCLTCTYVNTINIVYLHNSKCIIICPNGFWMNSSVGLDHQCSPCNSFCTVCFGPSSSECTACNNQTIGGASVIYYKDLNSTTCNTTCPDGQFILSSVPNVCTACSVKCLRCSTAAENCFQCSLAYFLFNATNTCYAQCPLNYYNNPIITPNNYYCTQCTDGCLNCTGPTLSSCTTCKNLTNSTTPYFKHPTLSVCNNSCPVGYFGNATSNKCDSCQTGCINCTSNASYCFACESAGGNDYFKTKMTNSCVLICPNGYYGNSSDYTCHTCIYYTIEGSCVFTCPSNTFAQF